jgi:16S rRNA (guanine527-N7)-methyltransferase
MLDAARITNLLQPFLAETSLGAPSLLPLPEWVLSPELAAHLQTYLDLLLRWNARMNLTAIRDPEQIVTRHFGESFFAARVLRGAGALSSDATLADVGSGAGFPGIPIKLFAPELHVTLIESQNKKATFLREVIRALALSHIVVHCGRAEDWNHRTSVVTLRAVEKFDTVLPVASSLVASGGTLCLLIGEAQSHAASNATGRTWSPAVSRAIPESGERIVWLARRATGRLQP